MENSPRFDLPAALENWRAELAAQSNLTAEVRRELETHLRDTLAGFQQRGLSDEEAFWLARRRVGQLPQVGEEFVKADPLAVWRERVFWMAVTLLIYSLWSLVANNIHFLVYNLITSWETWHYRDHLDTWSAWNPLINSLLSIAVRLIPLGLAAVYLLKGRLNRNTSFVVFFFSRKKILLLTAVILIMNTLLMFGMQPRSGNFSGGTIHVQIGLLLVNMLPTILWLLSLAGFTAWLLPTQNKKPVQSV